MATPVCDCSPRIIFGGYVRTLSLENKGVRGKMCISSENRNYGSWTDVCFELAQMALKVYYQGIAVRSIRRADLWYLSCAKNVDLGQQRDAFLALCTFLVMCLWCCNCPEIFKR